MSDLTLNENTPTGRPPIDGAQMLSKDQIVTLADGRQFRIVHLLGEGLTAEVYRARLVDSERQVALKALKPDLAEEFRQSFMDEANTLSLLRAEERATGDGLVLIPEVIARPRAQDKPPILVMELVESRSVLDLLEERTLLPEMTVLIIADQVLRVLHLLHTQLHKSYTDFQLRNIRWQEDRQQIKLIDWNHVSREAPEGQPPPGVPADLVRVGAYLYQMLTGKGAFQTGEPAGALAARAGEQWTTKVSTGTRFIVERALHPNPARRFPTAADFRQAIREQIELWTQDEDELDDETTRAVRESRNEERRRDPAQLQRAAVLVDIFHRRRPGNQRTAQWRDEIAGYTEKVSPAWGAGRQYFRAELYSKAVELWAEEASAWQRPDLWRWLVVARQAADNPTAFAPHVQTFEGILELMAQGHWQEARQRLAKLPPGPVDDLGREAGAYEAVAAAEADERAHPPRVAEAAANYRAAAKLLNDMRDDGYRATIQDVYGWAGLDARVREAQRRGQQLVSDAQEVEKLRRVSPTSNALLSGAVAALRANPGNLALFDFIAERAADKALAPERRKDLALAALEFGNPSEVMRDRLRSLRDAAQLEIYSRVVTDLRRWPQDSGELLAGLTAAVAAFPKNVALYDFALELAEDKALSPERRQDFAQAALRGVPPEATRGRLQAATAAAQGLIDERLAAESRAEEARLKKEDDARQEQLRQEAAAKEEQERRAQEAEEEQRRQEEIARKQTEEQHKAALHRQEMLEKEEEARRAEELVAAETKKRKAHSAVEMERALSAGDWTKITALVAVASDSVPTEVSRQAQKAFEAALKTRNEDEARRLAYILDQFDGDNQADRDQQIRKMSVKRDELMDEVHQVQALLKVAAAELDVAPPNPERAQQAFVRAESALDGLRRETTNGKWAGLLPDHVVPGLQKELSAVRARLSPDENDGFDLMALLKRFWFLPVVALTFLLAGVGLGFALAPEPPAPTPTPIAEITPMATEIDALDPVASTTPTPTATLTPVPTLTPTATLTPTVAVTSEPPTIEPTTTALPTDLGISGDSSPRVADGIYLDLPDLDLIAPADSTFDWSSGELRWNDPQTQTSQAVVLTVTNADGTQQVLSQAVPAAVVVADPPPVAADGVIPTATPLPDGATSPTSATAIRLVWANQLATPPPPPLTPGEYQLNLALRDDSGAELAVLNMPQPFTVAPPALLKIAAGQTYRQLPIMAVSCKIDRPGQPTSEGTPVVNPALDVEAIGWYVSGNNENFYQIRLPGERQVYWLAYGAVVATDIEQNWQALTAPGQLPRINLGPLDTKCD